MKNSDNLRGGWLTLYKFLEIHGS